MGPDPVVSPDPNNSSLDPNNLSPDSALSPGPNYSSPDLDPNMAVNQNLLVSTVDSDLNLVIASGTNGSSSGPDGDDRIMGPDGDNRTVDATEEYEKMIYMIDVSLPCVNSSRHSQDTYPMGGLVNTIDHIDDNPVAPLHVTPYSQKSDLLRIIVGPLIGLVTDSSSTVLIEFNQDIKNLRCLLRPIIPNKLNNNNRDDNNDNNDDEKKETDNKLQDNNENKNEKINETKVNDIEGKRNNDISLVVESIEEFKITSLKFDKLLENTLYYILLPDITGDKYIGHFRTFTRIPNYTEINILGGPTGQFGGLGDYSIVDKIVTYIENQQSLDLSGLKSFIGAQSVLTHVQANPGPCLGI
jgi:hypothetical protein